jgi:hypothetical protein
MYSTTVRVAIKGNISTKDIARHNIYVVRENDVIFYIGQSINPLSRLQEHLGQTWRSPSPSSIGLLILENADVSSEWAYDLYALEDCKNIVKMYRESLSNNDPVVFWKEVPHTSWVNECEHAMIWHFRPCLNIAANTKATPLPEKYRKEIETNPYGSKIVRLMLGLSTPKPKDRVTELESLAKNQMDLLEKCRKFIRDEHGNGPKILREIDDAQTEAEALLG